MFQKVQPESATRAPKQKRRADLSANPAFSFVDLERDTRFELATSTLARLEPLNSGPKSGRFSNDIQWLHSRRVAARRLDSREKCNPKCNPAPHATAAGDVQ